MNVVKTSVIGVDKPIQAFQTVLYNRLKPIWAYTDASFDMFGRVYRNQTKDGYTPEAYVGNGEYNDTFFDDTKSGTAFFGLGELTKVTNGDTQADVFLIFMVDLSKVKPGNPRNDEEARVDVEQIVMERLNGFFLSGIVLGIDNVFKEYSGYKVKDGIKFRDTQPWHCFRLNFKVTYNIYDC